MDGFNVSKLTKEEQQQEIEEKQLHDAIKVEKPALRKFSGKRPGSDIEEGPKKKRKPVENKNQEDLDNIAPSKGKRAGKKKKLEESKNQDEETAAPSRGERAGEDIGQNLKKQKKPKNKNQEVDNAAPLKGKRAGKKNEGKLKKPKLKEGQTQDADNGGTNDEEDLKKKLKVKENKNQDVENAASSEGKRAGTNIGQSLKKKKTKKNKNQAKGEAPKEKQELEQMTPPGTSMANDSPAPVTPEGGPPPPMQSEAPARAKHGSRLVKN
ncbi:hypothetical protein KR032_012273 [Drosophila birchii]|nr:hypothetical protein KR032_012273 [Drosophila birchii]